jgi:hypothetical protein
MYDVNVLDLHSGGFGQHNAAWRTDLVGYDAGVPGVIYFLPVLLCFMYTNFLYAGDIRRFFCWDDFCGTASTG